MTQTQQIIQYYANLLILQYVGKPKAFATIKSFAVNFLLGTSDIQFLKFSADATAGTFKLSYLGVQTGSLNYNDSAGTIQTALQAILPAGLTVVVAGTVNGGLLFTFTGFTSPVQMVVVSTNSLVPSGLIPTVIPVGDQLPLQIQNGFNLTGSNLAKGAQLDIIGKYVGVARSGYGIVGPIVLNDADFLQLIKFAIIRNSEGSSLASIQALIHQFFPGEVFVVDYTTMKMSYLISESIGSQNLIQVLVAEGLLPRPMAIGLSVIIAPTIDTFFSFRTYDAPASPSTKPFNTYDVYHTDWPWISYADAF